MAWETPKIYSGDVAVRGSCTYRVCNSAYVEPYYAGQSCSNVNSQPSS